ncbi:uncharacterized protein LOC142983172 isoform X1 [Anticarsia gemmatalis]|uniref:uncharacterized protein LOC142983172 isoform X1 n=1 Tax=Anticarsia gemmatalis TaxID=129554 RepID=UPI003F76D1CA
MRPSQPFLKMVIKVLILLILLVLMFVISAFLYSTRYWPDIYNYINANITIKRIPTISELDIQIVEVNVEYSTEMYSTTDAEYFEMSTIDDFDIDEFMKDELEVKHRTKRQVEVEEMKDYKELPSRGIFVDYIFLEEPIETNDTDAHAGNESDVLKTIVTKKIINGFEANREKVTTETNDKYMKLDNNKNYMKTANPETIQADNLVNIKTKNERTNKISKRMVNNFKAPFRYDEIELTTTKEGYLVGDGSINQVDQPEELVDITTDDDDYRDEVDGARLIKDLGDTQGLTTRSLDVEMVTGKSVAGLQRMLDLTCRGNTSCESFTTSVNPWVATIFVKNDSENSQFNYYCDGALLSEKVVLTGGRCTLLSGKQIEPKDILVFLGKGNLHVMDGNEQLHRINSVILHENYTERDGTAINDLALLVMEDPTSLEGNIQKACIHTDDGEDLEEAATTAWGPSGHLLPIFFEKEKSDLCFDRDDNIFCATYGLNVPLCPSYGGIYATKRSFKWCLQGIFYGDPADRGICFNKNVLFTSLHKYYEWIYSVIDSN